MAKAIKIRKKNIVKENIVKGARKVRYREKDPYSKIIGGELRSGHVIRGGKGDDGYIIREGKVKSGSSQKTGHTIKKKNIVVDASYKDGALTQKDRERMRRLLKKKGRLISKY